jgi:hypothetical protein
MVSEAGLDKDVDRIPARPLGKQSGFDDAVQEDVWLLHPRHRRDRTSPVAV